MFFDVYLCAANNNQIVALKKIRLEVEDDGLPPTSIREISLLRSLKHPNIVEYVSISCPDWSFILLSNSLFVFFHQLEGRAPRVQQAPVPGL
jgi:serine/threonine protein kinase